MHENLEFKDYTKSIILFDQDSYDRTFIGGSKKLANTIQSSSVAKVLPAFLTSDSMLIFMSASLIVLGCIYQPFIFICLVVIPIVLHAIKVLENGVEPPFSKKPRGYIDYVSYKDFIGWMGVKSSAKGFSRFQLGEIFRKMHYHSPQEVSQALAIVKLEKDGLAAQFTSEVREKGVELRQSLRELFLEVKEEVFKDVYADEMKRVMAGEMLKLTGFRGQNPLGVAYRKDRALETYFNSKLKARELNDTL